MTHKQSNTLEINEYYSYGLQNLQTSSTQFGSKEQRYKYNGKELMKDFKLEAEDYGARLYSPQIGRWIVIDALAQKYARFSPYNYTLNNPIKFVDPDGNDVHIFGKDAQKTVDAIGRETGLQVSYDQKTGLVSASGEAKTDAAREFYSAVGDMNINVNLHTTDANTFDSKDGSTNNALLIGAFEGSEVIDGKVETKQLFNVEQSEKVEKAGVSTVGQDAIHEILESYIGGKENPGEPYSKKNFDNAHDKASALTPNSTTTTNYKDPFTKTFGVMDSKGKMVPLIEPSTPRKKFEDEKKK
jgi:RHS repeat-associated protein